MTNTKTEVVAVTGNTYPVKEQLKQLGARWNPLRKAWMVTADKSDQAKAIVAGAPMQRSFAPSSNGYRPGRRCYCEECGEPYRKGQRCWETGSTCVPSWE